MVSICQKISCRLAGIIFPWQEFFIRIWFFLIPIIVSTSENKSCKILFCLDEIVLFSIVVFFYAIGNHYWNYAKAQFLQKTSLILVETVFLAGEKLLFSFIRYSRQWKQFLPRETVFLSNSSFRQVGTNFLFSRNSTV